LRGRVGRAPSRNAVGALDRPTPRQPTQAVMEELRRHAPAPAADEGPRRQGAQGDDPCRRAAQAGPGCG
jgi:hypothetical protein